MSLASMSLIATLAACGGEASAKPGEPETLELRYQGSVGAVTFPELAEELGYLGPIKLKWVGNTISGPQDIQAAATGQTDFGGAFNGAIVKLAAAKAPIKAVIGYYGSDKDSYIGYYVLDGSPIKGRARPDRQEDRGQHPRGPLEAVLKEYLKRGGLTPEEIKQVELVVVPPVNTEQALRQGQIDVAALSGILRDKALERGGIRPLFKRHRPVRPLHRRQRTCSPRSSSSRTRTPSRSSSRASPRPSSGRRPTPARRSSPSRRRSSPSASRNEDATAIEFWKSSGVANKGGVIDDQGVPDLDRLAGARGRDQDRARSRPTDIYTNEFNPSGSGGAQMKIRDPSEGVGKKFRVRDDGPAEFTALDDITLDVRPGEFLALVGPSGCGKSTLLDLLAGLTTPTSGRILLDGDPITGPGLDRGIVFQQYALFPWRTALANIEFGLEAKGVPKRERAERASELPRSGRACAGSRTGIRTSSPAA